MTGTPTTQLLPPRKYSTTNVTRLLCAGAHLDSRFARAVIAELVDNRDRYAAPAYGYDSVAVLGHALAARRRRRVRNGLAVLAVVPPLLTAWTGTRWAPVLVLLAVWWLWAVAASEALIRTQTLITHLKRIDTNEQSDPEHVLFDWRVPYHKLLTANAASIVADQSGSGIYYSGFVPFVGAGTLTRSWSFAVLLNGALRTPVDVIRALDDTAIRAAPLPFAVADLTSYVQTRLNGILRDLAPAQERVHGLSVDRRYYRTALSQERPPPLLPGHAGSIGPEDYDSAREYLCVNVGSWGQELVTSIFVGFDLKGGALHTELHSYVLLPINAMFHEVDRLPAELTGRDVLNVAAGVPALAATRITRQATGTLRRARRHDRQRRDDHNSTALIMLSLLVLAPFPFLTLASTTPLLVTAGCVAALWLLTAVGRSAARKPDAAPTSTRPSRTRVAGRRRITDWGARTSIRDLASETDPHHFFQVVDQDKYTKVVERRLMDVIIDFLDDHGIDTTEYRNRQAAVLNFGIMQTGGGQVTNSGAIAMGAATSAAAGSPVQ